MLHLFLGCLGLPETSSWTELKNLDLSKAFNYTVRHLISVSIGVLY